MSYHCRCRHCDTRRALPKALDAYTRGPKCRNCGRRALRPDSWMNRRNTHATSCSCAGYWFPHRKGSPYCWFRKDGTGRYPGDEDFKDRRM